MPTIIGMPTATHRSARHARANIEQDGGIKICCCRMFTCVNLNFLSTNHGLMKVSEVILGSCCQTLLVRFGMESAADIGQAFNTCFTTVSSCLMTSSLLLFCYVLSTRTFNLVRQSLFVSIINNRPNICFVFCDFVHILFDIIIENYCKCFSITAWIIWIDTNFEVFPNILNDKIIGIKLKNMRLNVRSSIFFNDKFKNNRRFSFLIRFVWKIHGAAKLLNCSVC